MQNSVEIFSIALGLVEPWYVKEVVFDKEPRSRANPFAWPPLPRESLRVALD